MTEKTALRILVVSQYFWPEEFRINDLVGELVSRGHRVVVLTGLPNYPGGRVLEEYRARPEAFATYRGAEIVRARLLPRGSGGGLRLALNYLSFAVMGSMAACLRLRRRRFDVLFVFQTSPVTAALPALLFRRTHGTPLILWIQDLWPDTLRAVGAVRSSKVLGLVGRMVRFIYRRSDMILIQSRAFADNVSARAAPSTRVEYLPNWADPAVTGVGGIRPAAELEAYASTFNVMFTGNIGEAQDLLRVVEAADRCRDIQNLRWLIVGEGRALKALSAEIDRRGLSEVVILLGRYPAARMPEFFAGADALLVSLRAEPIFAMTVPSKVQSYMAAGRPILGMLDGEGARVIEEAGCGLVAPAGDPAALADAARQLILLPAEARQQMGRAARDYAERHFEQHELVTRLEGWMRELTRPAP